MHSILFRIGPVPIFSYGFMLMVAFLVAAVLATREARRQRLEPEAILDLAPWILVASVLGARLAFVAQNADYFAAHPVEIFKVWTGGLTFHGGLAGGILAGVIFTWRRRLPFWRMADVIAPSLAIGYAIGRIGCFLNGCCYGSPTDLPWACRFPDSLASGGLTPPSHPVQLYAAAINVGIFLILQRSARRTSTPGQVMLSYVVLYSLYRFGIEFLRRGATASVIAGLITPAQLLSLVLIACALVGLVLLRRWRAEAPLPVGARRR
jgi:phosphatidylglycerol:prolipoprotein diacylglycerol transferase